MHIHTPSSTGQEFFDMELGWKTMAGFHRDKVTVVPGSYTMVAVVSQDPERETMRNLFAESYHLPKALP